MDAIQEALFNGMAAVIVALVGWLTTKVVNYLKELGKTEKLANKQYKFGRTKMVQSSWPMLEKKRLNY